MKKIIVNFSLVAVGLFILIALSNCGQYLYSDDGCEGEYFDYSPKIYDTFNLIDSNKAWGYNDHLFIKTFINTNGYKAVFTCIEASKYFYDNFVEHVDQDENRCINEGYNIVKLEGEHEHWVCRELPMEIWFSRGASSSGIDYFNKDSVQSSYIGEGFSVRFIGPDCSFGFSTKKYPPYEFQAEVLDSLTLNGKLWTNVIHNSQVSHPSVDGKIYVKGIYIKWGVGLIGFYLSNNEIWSLEI